MYIPPSNVAKASAATVRVNNVRKWDAPSNMDQWGQLLPNPITDTGYYHF